MSALAADTAPLVHIDDVHTYYGKSHILNGVSLKVERCEVVGLLGRNGVGKSTTLKTIMGLVRPSRGTVLFDGALITGLPPHKLARLGIGYVPEDRRIFRLLTVMENLRTGLDRNGVTEERRQKLLDKAFAYFPVLAERRTQAGEGLMPRMVTQIEQIIEVLKQEGVAILLVEQNVPLTLAASRRVYIMEKGTVRHHCAASEIDANHAVIKQYLGV